MKMRPIVRASARAGIAALACTMVALVTIQFGRIVERNVNYARQVSDVQHDVAGLERKREAQLREIRRLSDPQGAIPEIHDRLRLVTDKEAIIYLKKHE